MRTRATATSAIAGPMRSRATANPLVSFPTLRAATLLIALSGPTACKKDAPREDKAAPPAAPVEIAEPSAQPAPRPWFVGRFEGEIPLVELPFAPERLPKKQREEGSLPVPRGHARLSVTIDEDRRAHLELTAPFPQRAETSLEHDEIRTRFIPTPELLGSGTILLEREGDSFVGQLSLLDPTRTMPLAGTIAEGALTKSSAP